MDDILLIDDDERVLDFLWQFLIRTGYGVKIARSGEDGIDLFNNNFNIWMVITDIRMPGMDGNEVAKHIRKSDKSDIPIVAITGSGDDANRELFNAVLEKPFKLETLIDIIKGFRRRDMGT